MSGFSWDQAQLFRCRTCGKWSHAKKQPRKHQRWVSPGDEEYSADLNENQWGDVPDGHGIECGPFTPWVATPGRLR